MWATYLAMGLVQVGGQWEHCLHNVSCVRGPQLLGHCGCCHWMFVQHGSIVWGGRHCHTCSRVCLATARRGRHLHQDPALVLWHGIKLGQGLRPGPRHGGQANRHGFPMWMITAAGEHWDRACPLYHDAYEVFVNISDITSTCQAKTRSQGLCKGTWD